MEQVKILPIQSTDKHIIGFGTSNIGGRDENQDTGAWTDTPYGFLAIVCDGMGGGPSGKTASTIAVQEICDRMKEAPAEFSSQDLIEYVKETIKAANQALMDFEAAHPETKGMGSTLAMVLINKQHAIIAHVGDSRVYQLRGHRKIFRTWDHSMVFSMLRAGDIKSEEEARQHPRSNVITQALGLQEVNPEIDIRPYEKGDLFVLCSDGIWGVRPEKQWLGELTHATSLSGAVESVAIRTNQIGCSLGNKHDNLTIEAIQVNTNSIDKEVMSKNQRILFYALGILLALSVIVNLILWFAWPTQTTIDELKAERSELRNEVKDLKAQIKDQPASKEVASENKAEEKAKLETEQKVEPEQKEEQGTAQDAEDEEAHIKAAMDLLAAAYNAGNTKERKNRVEAAIKELEDARDSGKYSGANLQQINLSISELKKDIAKRMDDRGKGQINTIKTQLSKIK